MASRRTSTSAVLHRSISPAARRSSASPSFFRDHQIHHRSSSPTRVNLIGGKVAPVRSHVLSRPISSPAVSGRRTCMCSPTTHPGSFRCSLHKGFQSGVRSHADSSPSNRLNMRRSAMTNSLVRIGTVEGEIVKRALAALIRPSSHQQRRRAGFQARPSRLSIMSVASDS